MAAWILGRGRLGEDRPSHLARLVSLAPSMTANLIALGFADRIVGFSDECEELFDEPLGLSLGSFTDIDEGVLAAVNPDLVLGDRLLNTSENLNAIQRQGFPMAIAEVEGLESSAVFLEELGELLEVAPKAEPMLRELRALLAESPSSELAGRRVGILHPDASGRCLSEATYPASLLRWLGASVVTWEGELSEAVSAEAELILCPIEEEVLPEDLRECPKLRLIRPATVLCFGAGTVASVHEIRGDLSTG
ncbi:MAG: hypothetical protein RL885_15950 [Planctomycetota bacterium]